MDASVPANTFTAISQIIVVDILLSGDNAVVIALACRNLAERYKRAAILGGTAGAVLVRLAFCFVISWLMEVPALKLIGGALLLWIGVKLMVPEQAEGEGGVQTAANFWGAMRTIIVADVVMSFDNVIAIVAAAKGHFGLIVFGLALSIPIIVFGSQMVLKVLNRWPVLVTAGAGLLGWLGGEIMTHDPLFHGLALAPWATRIAAAVGAAIVVGVGTVLKRRAAARHSQIHDLRLEETK
jgi:YjbE family integral membrane protein